MPRKEQGWITFQSSEEEREILEHFCQQNQRTKTEILRELVRSLRRNAAASLPAPSAILKAESFVLSDEVEEPERVQPIKVSARNVIRGSIRAIETSPVNTEVTLEVAPGVLLVSVITTASAKRLQLFEGKEMYAVIKSSSIMLAEASE